MSFASQKAREIAPGTAFCILGRLQPGSAAQLFTALDVGKGFIKQIL